jgi:hypothetical protein
MILAAAVLSVVVSDDALLDDLQRRSVQFFWNESHPVTGFAKDRAANFADRDDYSISSCASTGFAVAAYPIGVERGWLKRDEALERTRRTFRHLKERHAQMNGWFAHFVNWETGNREWQCEFSTIDTGILLSGMLVAERYWKDPEVSKLFTDILNRVDWKWAMTDGGAKPRERLFGHGYRPEGGGFLENRWSTDYSEEKLLYVLGYGADPKLPTGGWERIGRRVQTYQGIEFLTGGPLFIHQMSESFFSFSGMRDRLGYNYWIATRNATLANRAYCIANPKGFKGYGPTFWGLSASDIPGGYTANGAPGWISDDGTVTPTSGIASLPFTPKESMELAQGLYQNYRYAWGRYGFSNGINPAKDWKGPDVLGIDLGMMLLGIENYRTGLVWKLTASSPVVQRGMQRIGFRKDPEGNSGPLRKLPRQPGRDQVR